MSRGRYQRQVKTLRCTCGAPFKGKRNGSLCPDCRRENKRRHDRKYREQHPRVAIGPGRGNFERRQRQACCVLCKREFSAFARTKYRVCPRCVRRISGMRKKHRLRSGEGDPLKLQDVLEIIGRDGMICTYCLASLDADTWCIDHIVPVSRGGSNDPENLCMSCLSCNQQKSTKTGVEFAKWREDKTPFDCRIEDQIGGK